MLVFCFCLSHTLWIGHHRFPPSLNNSNQWNSSGVALALARASVHCWVHTSGPPVSSIRIAFISLCPFFPPECQTSRDVPSFTLNIRGDFTLVSRKVCHSALFGTAQMHDHQHICI